MKLALNKHPSVPKLTLELLKQIGTLGSELNMPVYAVGGFVRDALLEIPANEILVCDKPGIYKQPLKRRT